MSNRTRATLLALLVAAVTTAVLLYAGVVMAAEGSPTDSGVAVSTGAGGLGIGALSMWLALHGRLKAAEATLASIGPQLPALVQRVEQLVSNLETLSKAMREDGLAQRGKIHDLRGAIAKHEGRIIRLEERFNGLRDAVEDGQHDAHALPRPITDDVTGPTDVDTGRHRSLGRLR